MNDPILLLNETQEAKILTRDISLASGAYRFLIKYHILENPNDNVNLLHIMISVPGQPQPFRSVLLPKKITPGPARGPQQCRLNILLPSDALVKLSITMNDIGRVEIQNIEVAKEDVARMPDNPVALFINHDRHLTSEHLIPQGISAIAAYLRARGINCHALITSTSGDELIMDSIDRWGYAYVGFYANSDATTIRSVRTLTEKIKARRPQTTLIAGGPHATLAPLELMAEIPLVDICVQGEGEQTCYELFSGASRETISGITFRDGQKVIRNAARPLLPASELSAPVRDNYFNADWTAHSLSTSRGCPNNCHFCIGHRIYGRTIRFRPLEQIDRELQWIYEHSDHSLVVSINDDMFNMKRSRTLALMEIFKKYPFQYFPRGVRADRLDEETTRAMREAGVVGTRIGIESADNDALRAMRKGETIEDIERGIHHLRSNGIGIVGQFIIGNIGDTLETVKKTIDFALRHKFEGINMSCAIPFPGTDLREYIVRNGLMLKEPYAAAQGIVNGGTTIYFETPSFPLSDRIKAVELAIEAGLLIRG
jgi:anaerobic magnesium-protoporphyrin IX monomethyl ester cyclase